MTKADDFCCNCSFKSKLLVYYHVLYVNLIIAHSQKIEKKWNCLRTMQNEIMLINHDDYEKLTTFEAVYLDVKRSDCFLVCP